MKKKFLLFLTPLIFMTVSLKAHTQSDIKSFKKELGFDVVSLEQPKKNLCRFIIVHHGHTNWSDKAVRGENIRLMGQIQGISLNANGKAQMKKVAEELSEIDIAAIYTSSSTQAVESANIIAKDRKIDILQTPIFQGESHGEIEGKFRNEYQKIQHYIENKKLDAYGRFFSSMGKGGEGKADLAKRVVPLMQTIAKDNEGRTFVIVTHGGLPKLFEFLKERNYNSTNNRFVGIPNGGTMDLYSDGENFYFP